MVTVSLILLVLAFVLFLVAAFGYALGKVAPGWLGAASATLAILLGHIKW